MANLSNINGKFLFTDGDFLLIGGATANSISATESGVAIKNSNAATLSLQNSATNGKNHTLWSNTDGSFNITDVGVATRFTIASGGDVYIPSGNVSIGNNSVASSGSNTILEIYSVSVPRLKLKNSTTGTAELAGSSFYLTGDDLIINNGETSGVIQFEIGGGTPIMRMKYGGNVGIGTIFPTAKLQVESTSAGAATVAAFLVNSNVTVNTETRLAFAAHTNSDIATNRYSYISTINTSGSNGQDMIFATNETGASAVERMRIDSSGFVTIKNNAGTTNASLTFSNSDTDVGANQSIGYLNFYSNDASTTSTGGVGGIAVKSEEAFNTSYTPTYMSFYTHERTANDGTTLGNVTERMRITSGGNVGINDTIGYGKLAIKTSGTFTTDSNDLDFSGVNILMKTTNTATNAVGSGIVWLKGGSSTRKVAAITNYTYGDTDQSGLNFYVQETASGSTASLSEAMRIDSSGNVGIGTDSPAVKLEVVETTASTDCIVRIKATRDAYLQFSPADTTKWALIADYPASGDFTTYNYPNNFNSIIYKDNKDIITNTGGGNFGIGTTSPAALLDVAGNIYGVRLYVNSGGNATDPMIRVKTDTNTGIFFPAADTLAITTGGSEKMRITSGGNVLIGGFAANGSVSPTLNGFGFTPSGTGTVVCNFSDTNEMIVLNQRDGQGTTQFEFRNGNVERGRIEWTTSGTTYNTISDYRLKENITNLTGSLAKINQLEPKVFNFISDPDDPKIGFIAHEVQDIVPQAVTGVRDDIREDGTPKYQGLDHSMLVPLLVGAIKELKAEIETLKTQINN